jgi:hypothetical protein
MLNRVRPVDYRLAQPCEVRVHEPFDHHKALLFNQPAQGGDPWRKIFGIFSEAGKWRRRMAQDGVNRCSPYEY